MQYLLIFICTGVLSYLFTKVIRKVALTRNIVDEPGLERKVHTEGVPLLGGVGIFLAFFLVLFFFRERVFVYDLAIFNWFGVFAGSLVLIVGGYLDDRYNLPPLKQILFPALAAICVILGGVEVSKMTNPISGDYIYLSSLVSGFFIFLWLMGSMYTTKLLDGLDGLVSGVVGIGAIVIFIFTNISKYYQPDIGLVSLILAGACAGFLVLNWHPAKIFLGEGGSLFLGFMIGVLAIISGGKVAIALLVMGIPIIDTAWTITRRLLKGGNPLLLADRLHLHHLLNDSGLGVRKTVLLYYLVATLFGVVALFLQSWGKLLLLLALLIIMITCVIYINKKKLTYQHVSEPN